MQNHYTVRGIPNSLAMDGWWLSCSENTSSAADIKSVTPSRPASEKRPWVPVLWISLLVALADFLFWNQILGLSLVVYAFAIFAVSTDKLPLNFRIRPAILLLLGGLPVVEYVQLLSLVFLGGALLVSLVWAHHPNISTSKYAHAAFRLFSTIPIAGLCALLAKFRSVDKDTKGNSSRSIKLIARNWAFPIGGSLIFMSLLIDANPILAQILSLDFSQLPPIDRIMFWLGLGLVLWPLIDGQKFEYRDLHIPFTGAKMPNIGLNAGSVLRSLVLFNLLIGAQTVLDFSIFTGGSDLPDGMSYATYAHRGAYPLVITALLAGAFAIAARPFLGEHRMLKPLLILWLAQNTFLCLSAGLRLDLYIEAYGLTYLRVRALIWMCMVAIGLLFTLWQILRAHSNRWLVFRCIYLAVGVLYVGCFVNFAAIIATVNIANQKAGPFYICDLGPTTYRVIRDASARASFDIESDEFLKNLHACQPKASTIDGWRDWGVRKWRTSE